MDAQEKIGSRDILEKLSNEELDSLKETVTKKQIAASGRKECISAIITYSESAKELLSRRKLKREVLFQYLADEHVVVSVNSEKHQLINAIIRHWYHGSRVEQQQSERRIQLSQQQTPPQRDIQLVQQQTRLPTDSRNESTQQQRDIHNRHQTHLPRDHPQFQVTQTNVYYTVNVATPATNTNQCSSPVTDVELSHTIGEKFADWFYKLLNSHNPTTGNPAEDFGPHHFWPDVRFQLLSVTSESHKETFSGAELTAQRLLALVKDEQLLFNPNVSQDGVRVKSYPHGQIQMVVCGTIHRGNDCLGEFEQLFGLLSDPSKDNNWKVKFSTLRIRSSQVTAMPKLTDTAVNKMTALVPM